MIHAIMPAMRGHAGSVLFPRDTHPHDTIDVVIDSPRRRSLRAVATRECWLRVRVSQLESQSSHHRQLGGSNMRTITFAIALFVTALIGALSGSFRPGAGAAHVCVRDRLRQKSLYARAALSHVSIRA